MRSRLISAIGLLAAAFLLLTNPILAEAAGQITGAQIKNNSVKGKDIKDNNLQGNDVKDASLTGTDLADGSVAGTDVQDDSLTSSDIKDSSVTSSDVAADALTGADVDESTLVVPGKPGVKTFSGVSFLPRVTVAWAYGGVGRVYPTASAGEFWTVRLDLPEGATINHVTFHAVDNSASKGDGFLTTYNPSNGAFEDIASASSAGSAGLESFGFDTSAVVNNATNAYYLLFRFNGVSDGTIQLAGATVSYTFDATIGSGAKPYSGAGSE